MAEIFLKVLNMSISVSWLILVVLVLRVLLKRAPKRLRMLLWALVGLRAVLPFSIESSLSLIPSAETVSPEIVRYAARPTIDTGVQFINDAVNPIISEGFAAPSTAASVNPMYVASFIAAVVWLVGLAAMLVYAAVSYTALLRRVGTAELEYENVYRSPLISEPFVLGIFRPIIYLPKSLDKHDEEYVLRHERAHIERRDTLTRPLGYLILSLHWFNPLMWLAWRLFCRDIEYACDESVISGLERNQRADYSQALLNCSAHSGRRSVSPLAFGEGVVKERIKQVLSYKKPAVWIVAGTAAVLVVLAVCFLTDPEPGHEPANLHEVTVADGVDAPEQVLEAAREYVAREASHYVANITPPGGGAYELVSAAVTYASKHDVKAEIGDGALVFYEFSYDIVLDPDDEIDMMDSVGVTTAWASDELRLYMLFLEQDGKYTYIGEYNSAAIDMIYAESGMEERPDKYTAAAVDMYDRWLEQQGLGAPDELRGALIYRSGDTGFSIPAQTVTDPLALGRLWSGYENERGGTRGDGAHYIVFFYDRDDNGGSSSRMWNVCADSSYFDDITRLYEQVQIIERTDEDVLSALAAARAYYEASGTPVTRVWYDRNASSREVAYNFFMDPARASDISNYMIIYADSWQNSPQVIELTRESADMPWTARYNGVSTLASTDMGSDNVIVEG